jgi:hypothetical protein
MHHMSFVEIYITKNKSCFSLFFSSLYESYILISHAITEPFEYEKAHKICLSMLKLIYIKKVSIHKKNGAKRSRKKFESNNMR